MRIWFALLGACAGLFGAAGVALAAAGAHGRGGTTATTAATFALLHACALLAILALAGTARRPWPLMAAASLLATGTLLFSGDLALRALADIVIWHSAAPVGGSVLIGGWLVSAVAVPAAFFQKQAAN